MTTRPEALRLAEAIDPLTRYTLDNLTCSAAATELRRLHEENERLKAAWVGLTDEEIDAKTDFRATVRYFEAKLKERNQ